MSAPASGSFRRERLDLLVVGHTNIDHMIRVPHLPARDETVPSRKREVSLGGTAANIARWSAHLGLRVGLHSFVGPDLPPDFRQELGRLRVDLTGLKTRPGEFTPACWIVEDGRGGQTTVIDQGAMASTGKLPLPEGLLRSSRWVHITTGDPVYQLRLARAARVLGKTVAADPAQEIHYRWEPEALRELLSMSEAFFGNEREFAKLVELLHLSEPREVVELVPLAVVTRGPRGARAYSRSGRQDVKSPRVSRLAGVTGAGDAFRAGFYRAWFAGEPLEECLRWGTAAGATVVEIPRDPSGRLPPLEEIRRRRASLSPSNEDPQSG